MNIWRKLFKRFYLPSSPVRRRKRSRLILEFLEDRCVPATFYVNANGGNDGNSGLSPSAPVQSIQQAVNLANNLANGGSNQNNNVILVALGTYIYNGEATAAASVGFPCVVGVADQEVSIAGGYNAQFTAVTGQSIIDGQAVNGLRVHGVAVVSASKPTNMNMSGFIIQDCEAAPSTAVANTLDTFGGGMVIELAANFSTSPTEYLSNITFQNDTSLGSDWYSGANTTESAGEGVGGGLAVLNVNNLIMSNITFSNDTARGGFGPDRGGAGLGGGMYAGGNSHVQGTNITFTNNLSAGGTSTSGGTVSGLGSADAFGGAFELQNVGTSGTFTNLTATGNTAQGGNSGTSGNNTAGTGNGGAIYTEDSSLYVTQGVISGNTAAGGTASTVNASAGGGIYAFESAASANNIILEQVSLLNNTLSNGTGTQSPGGAVGGGLAMDDVGSQPLNVTVDNSVIAQNKVVSATGSSITGNSGGAGIWNNMATLSVTQSTIADNSVQSGTSMVGPAVLLFGGPLNLGYDIVADNASTSLPAIFLAGGGSTNLTGPDLFANNVAPTSFSGPSSDLLTAASADFTNEAGGDFTLQGNSPAINKGVGSTATVDRNNNPRGNPTTLGAYEYIFVAPVVEFSTLDFSVPQTAGVAVVTVELTSPTSPGTPVAYTSTVTVHYTTGNGSAVAPADYTPVSGTLTFNPGVTTQTFQVPIVDNPSQQGDIRVNLSLSNATGLQLGSDLTQAVVTIAGSQPSDNDSFVSGLYHNLLGRPVDSSGLSYFTGQLNSAEDALLPGVVLSFVDSQGYYARLAGDPNFGYYAHYLGRAATSAEANYWGNLQAFNGATDEQVIAGFVTSTEYFDDKGKSNDTTWLQAMYQDILGRPIDAAGQSYFLNQLNTGTSMNTVAMELLTSTEYRTDRINDFFSTYLNRPTNANDRSYWLGQFEAGATDEQIIAGIGGSAEGFVNNGDTAVNWINSLYQKTLGRAPLASELAYHLNALENDANTLFDNSYHLARYNVALNILTTSEYVNNPNRPINTSAALNVVISETFQAAFGITASSSDQAYWSSQFVGSSTQGLDIAAAIFASSNYFDLSHTYP